MTSAEQELMERAVFGKQVQDFLDSDVGQYMLARAADKKQTAIEKLCQCDPDNAGLVREHQNEVWLAEHIVTWLTDAVKDGLSTLNLLETRSENHED